MVVGVLRVDLSIPGNRSLKGKRSVVRKVLDRVRNRFQVSAAEVAHLDAHQRAGLAFAVVSNDGRHANEMLDRIADAVEGLGVAVLTARRTELVPIGDGPGTDDGMLDPPEPW